MSETTYWALGGFSGVVAVATIFAGAIVVAVAAALVAAILFATAHRSSRSR